MSKTAECNEGHTWPFEGDEATPCPECGLQAKTMAPALPGPSAGANLPCVEGYEIGERIGGGGMGDVYLARQTTLRRDVAIKVVRQGSHDPLWKARFRREAGELAKFEHPNIVAVYHFDEKHPALIMEYVRGQDLAQALRTTKCTPVEAARLVRILASALDAVHDRGIIHRDLKPQNVLLEGPIDRPLGERTPKLVDFGLAKQLGETDQLTETGKLVGTPYYMAPEQVMGRWGKLGPGTDVYGLGGILYFCLTGKAPFSNAETLHDPFQLVMQELPVPPRRYDPTVPVDLDTICLKCLEKKPGRRYLSAKALADHLGLFLAAQECRANPHMPPPKPFIRPVGLWGRLLRLAERKPRLAAGIVASALAILVLLVLSVGWAVTSELDRGRIQTALDRVTDEQKKTKEEEGKTRAALEQVKGEQVKTKAEKAETQRTASRATMERGQTLCRQGEIGQGLLLFDKALELLPVGEAPMRRVLALQIANWEQRLTRLRLVIPHDRPVYVVAFHPDGKSLFAGDDAGMVRRWGLDGKEIGPGLKHPRRVYSLAVSGKNETILTGCEDGIARLWRVGATKPDVVCKGHTGFIRTVAISPDGRTAATGGKDATARLFDVNSGHEIDRFEDHKGTVEAVSFSPDGKRLLTASADGAARCWDLASGKEIGKGMIHESPVHSAMFRQSGALAFTGDESGLLRLWDTDRSALANRHYQHPNAVTALAFHAKSERILTGCGDGRVRVLKDWLGWLQLVGQPLPQSDSADSVAWHPDGTRLISAGGSSGGEGIRLWHLAEEPFTTERGFGDSEQHRVPVRGRSVMTSDPEMRTTAVVLPSGRVIGVYDTGSGKVEVALPHAGEFPTVVMLSPDRKRLVVGCEDGTFQMWDFGRWKADQVKRLFSAKYSQPHLEWKGKRYAVQCMAHHPTKPKIAVASTNGEVVIWDLTGPPVSRRLFEANTWANIATAMAYDPTGKYLLTGDYTGLARLYETATAKRVFEWASHKGPIESVAFSPDGTEMVTAGQDRFARRWSVSTGKPICSPMQHEGIVTRVAFNKDGKLLVTASDQEAQVWDVQTGIAIGPPIRYKIRLCDIAFSADSTSILTNTFEDRRVTERVAGKEAESVKLYHVFRKWPIVPDDRLSPDTRRRLELATGLRLEAGQFAALTAAQWTSAHRKSKTDPPEKE